MTIIDSPYIVILDYILFRLLNIIRSYMLWWTFNWS